MLRFVHIVILFDDHHFYGRKQQLPKQIGGCSLYFYFLLFGQTFIGTEYTAENIAP
jgi:hypothetical protein